MDTILKGVIPPMVTPLTAEGDLDVSGLDRLIEHLIDGGVHGIFLLGTTGEAPSLSFELKKELIDRACEIIDKRVQVLVGITDTVFKSSVILSEHAQTAGADAIVVAPPFYFPISENEMHDYLVSLVAELTLPFVLYNMPSCTKMHLSIHFVEQAKQLGAIGVKDSSGDFDYLLSLIQTFKNDSNFSIIAGTESFLSNTVSNGGHGSVAGGANFQPKLYVDLYNAALNNDLALVEQLNRKVQFIQDSIYKVGMYNSRFVKGIKCALSVLNICDDYMALPLRRFDEKRRKLIDGYIRQLQEDSIN